MQNQDSGGNTKGDNSNIQTFNQLSDPDSYVWNLIFDGLPYMVSLIDNQNIIVKANKAMRHRIAKGESTLIGNKCYTGMHGIDCRLTNCPHQSMMKDGLEHSVEIFEPLLGCYLDITTTPLYNYEHELLGSLHIIRDITIQKEAELKLKKYNDELIELNQSKDKLYSLIAHDLRSPFQGIIGFTELIISDINDLEKEEIVSCLQKVNQSSYSTLLLLENLLNWSRLQTGKLVVNPSAFSINEDVNRITNILEANASNKGITIENNINKSIVVFADQQMVHSILLNLINNAIKFSFWGGLITIDANDQTNKDIEVAESASNYIEISITDNGTGIKKEIAESLFRGNESSSSLIGTANEKGTGIGLHLVKEMLDLNGGTIKIQSTERKGTQITFSLPLLSRNTF